MHPLLQIRRAPAALLCLSVLVFALTLPPAVAQPSRPKVGLVLGGGGARGVAHLGVLKVLEEMRIPVDCIAGTSMGSLVGGVYAAGMPADRMTEALGKIDWDDLFDDNPPRTQKPFRAKADDYLNLFRFEVGLRGASVVLPPGATAGYKFEFLLRELVQQTGNFTSQDFDRLPIPYRAIATDLESATSRVFDRGDLVKAMRASMSVPGAIAPVEIDGRIYVDGGLLQNVPIQAVRDMCADVVIAVNVGSGLLPRDQLQSAVGVTLQMINVMMEQNVRASIASMREADVLIEPKLGDFGSADFQNAIRVTVPLGEAAARAKAEELRKLSLSEAEYRNWRESVLARLPAIPAVTDIRVTTIGGQKGREVNPQVIENELAEQPGIDIRKRPETDFSLTNLQDRLVQVYGRGDFERMDYHFVDRPGGRTVEVEGVAKSWGPNYLKFGLGLAGDNKENRYNVSASHRMTWLNSLGAEWRNDFQTGYTDRLSTEFYQPVALRAGAFVAPRVEWENEPYVYYLGNSRIGDYRVQHLRGHLDAGLQNKYGEVRLGLFGGRLKATEDFGVLSSLVPNYDLTQVGYTARAIVDQVDSPFFPRSGVLASIGTFGTLESLGSEDQYNKTELLLVGAKSFGPHSLQLAGYTGRTLSGDLPPYDPFRLGGFLRGSGYLMDQLSGRNQSLVRAVYSYELAKLPAPLGRGVYLGGSLEAVRAAILEDPRAASVTQTLPSFSVFIGADTFLGPVFLAWGKALSGDKPDTFYFLLGIP